MWKTGHSLIKAKMRETDAELAGEMSGHFFFRERWFGFDDGIYAAARLLRDPRDRRPHARRRSFDELPEGRVDAGDQGPMRRKATHYAFVERFRDKAQLRRRAPVDHRRRARGLSRRLGPGARVEHDAGAGAALRRRHAGGARRASRTTFRAQLLAIDPTLELPF